jgi:hypothetical protein
MEEQVATKTAEPKVAKEVETLTHDPIWLNTVRGAVTVYGHKLISKHTLNIVGACLNLPEFEEMDHGLYELVFTNEEILDTEDNKVYAMFYPEPKAIVVSLPKIWDNAIEEALSEEKHVSVVCAIHHNLLFHIFHDIHHAASCAAGVDIFDETEDEENKANVWANEKIVELAKIVDIEPTWQDEPWFSPLIKEFFLTLADDEKDPNVLEAKEMIEKEILIHDKEEGKEDLVITSFREFVKLLNNDSEGWDDQVLTKNFLNETVTGKPTVTETTTEQEVKPSSSFSPWDAIDDLPSIENEGVMFGGEGIKTTDHPETMVAAAFGGNPVPTNQPAPILTEQSETTPTPVQTFPAFSSADGLAQRHTKFQAETNVMLPNVFDTGKIMAKVYMACYQHIFNNCKMLINSDVAFQIPQFVLSTPVDLNAIPGAKELIVGADINDPESGVFQVKVPVVNGLLFGNLKKNTMLPGYTLHINDNGEYSTRALIPQNPVTGSTTAIRARAGNAIMWIIDGSKARDDGARWKYKIENGVITPCQQFGASA